MRLTCKSLRDRYAEICVKEMKDQLFCLIFIVHLARNKIP